VSEFPGMAKDVQQVAVVGTICLDTIYPYGGDKITGLGGIYYSLSALANLSAKRNDLSICPCGE